MRGLTFAGELRLRDDLPVPQPRPHEALVRVRMAGICNTDLELTRGYKGFAGTLGHEFVGVVVEASETKWIGRRVAGEINLGCGACERCAEGLRNHCDRRRVLGILDWPGAFAEYLVLPVENLHRLPDSVDDEQAIFVEPLAAAFQIAEAVQLRPKMTVVVLGDGKLGNLCAQALAADGLQPVVVGKHPSKLQLLALRGLQTLTRDDYLPRSVDLVVEATGSPSGLAMALDLVRPRGTVVLKSTFAGPASVDLSPLVVNEVSVVGSRCGPFPRAIRALQGGEVDVRPLISARYPLDRSDEAMRRAASPGILKVLLEIAGGPDGG